MPYILNKTNGSVVATVADGSINQTTDLTFVGKNYAGYGEIINENLLKLLENFSNRTAPSKAIMGQLWFDSSSKRLKVRTGNFWNTMPYVEYAATQPKTLLDGDMWFNTSNNKLYIKNSSEISGFTLIGPSISSSGLSSSSVISVTTVVDTDDNQQTVFTHSINAEVVLVISNSTFNVNPTDALYSKFKTIKEGITLANSDATSGVSSSSGFYFWGTAANAEGLYNKNSDTFYSADDFVLASAVSELFDLTNGFDVLNDNGILVGTNSIIRVHADSGQEEGKISVVGGNKLSFNLRYPTSADPVTNILNIIGNKVLPGSSVTVDFGANSAGSRFGNMFVNTVTTTNVISGTVNATTGTFTTVSSGNFAGNVSGNLTGSVVTATNIYGTLTGPVVSTSISAGADTINGTITGKWSLVGASTMQATYADLAERYEADDVYEPGTVLMLGGEKEVTLARYHATTAVAGIVSTNPAYMLNAEAGNNDTHPYIALKGRVPCKICGSVKKGDLLVASGYKHGYATKKQDQDSPNAVIGKSLEDFEGTFGIIEVKV